MCARTWKPNGDFSRDDDFLNYGIRSYVALPLTKHGELIGVVDFLSVNRRSFTNRRSDVAAGRL